jgi:hypothetical protein
VQPDRHDHHRGDEEQDADALDQVEKDDPTVVTSVPLCTKTKMFLSTIRNPKTIQPRVRIAADPSKVTTKSNAIRNTCLEATIRLITKLDAMGEGERHVATIRSLMLFSYMVPARIICIGLFPYEQDILPPIATALAYSPVSCLAPTPGVQVLAQGMAMSAARIRRGTRTGGRSRRSPRRRRRRAS